MPDDIVISSPTVYSDLPLDLTSPSIRQLTFWRNGIGQVSGQIETFETAKCPPFIPLSYEWGATQPEAHFILLQGRPSEVRENLYNALRHILHLIVGSDSDAQASSSIHPRDRLVDENGDPLRYIWIDAVCIDQENIAERNHQVSMMTEVYSAATLVLAWSGIASSETRRAVDLFRDYRRHSPALRIVYFLSNSSTRASVFRQFLDLEYFHRMWIVQELILARRIVFMCGSETLDGNVIYSCMNPCKELHDESVVKSNLPSTAGGRILGSWSTKELGLLLNHFADQKCSDERDKIFALLGLAEQDSPKVARLRSRLLRMPLALLTI